MIPEVEDLIGKAAETAANARDAEHIGSAMGLGKTLAEAGLQPEAASELSKLLGQSNSKRLFEDLLSSDKKVAAKAHAKSKWLVKQLNKSKIAKIKAIGSQIGKNAKIMLAGTALNEKAMAPNYIQPQTKNNANSGSGKGKGQGPANGGGYNV